MPAKAGIQELNLLGPAFAGATNREFFNVPVWDQLFPVERHRIANLMIERIDLVHVGEVQGIKVKWRELGWDKRIGEFAPQEIGAELLEVEA